MIDWYHAFLAGMVVVWICATEVDRSAANVVLFATIVSELSVDLVTSHITAPWKLIFPGAMETITILLLAQCSPTRTSFVQMGCVGVAWLAHALCFFDLLTGSNLVYDSYETILGMVALAQFVAFHDTLRSLLRLLSEKLGSVGLHRLSPVRLARLRHPLLFRQGHRGL